MVKSLPILIFICILGAVFFWKKETEPLAPIPRQIANEAEVKATTENSAASITTAAPPSAPETSQQATASFPQSTSLKAKAKASVTEERIVSPEPISQEVVAIPPEDLAKKIWFQLGLGGSHQSLKNIQDGGVESKFQCIELPVLSVSTGFEVDRFGVDLSFESQAGKVSSSSSTSVVGGAYKWENIKATGTLRSEKESSWKFHIGVQQETSPLIYPDPVSMEAYVRSAKLTEVTVGAEYIPEFTNSSRFFAKAYVFIPVSTSTLDRAELKIKPNLHASVSAGAQLLVSKRTFVGIQGKLQTQDYKFTFRDNPNAAEVEGKQSLTSSSIEFQLGWNF